MMVNSKSAEFKLVVPVEILIYGLIHSTLFHQSVAVTLHCDSIMSYYSS
jgi:hypothetical protein